MARGEINHIFPARHNPFFVTVFHGCETIIFIPPASILFPPQDMLYLVDFKGLFHKIIIFFKAL
jgi:hypothetical protein